MYIWAYLARQYSNITLGKGESHSGFSSNLPVLQSLGLVINQKKSILIPQQKMEFLGILVNAATLHLVFPVEKLRHAQHLLCQQIVLVTELVRLVGKTSASQSIHLFITEYYSF